MDSIGMGLTHFSTISHFTLIFNKTHYVVHKIHVRGMTMPFLTDYTNEIFQPKALHIGTLNFQNDDLVWLSRGTTYIWDYV